MSEVKQFDERRSIVLEGMYNGVAGKIEEIRQSVCQEIQYNSAQQVSAYDAIAASLKEGIASILSELRYLSQQNSVIYEYGQKEQAALQEKLVTAFKGLEEKLLSAREAEEKARAAQIEQSEKKLSERFVLLVDELDRRMEERLAALKAELAPPVEEEPAPEPEEEPADRFDYDTLAEKIATILPEVDYDTLTERVVAALPQTDENALVDKIAAAVPVTDEAAVADKVAEAIPPVDYDLISERVTAALEGEFDVRVDEEGISKIAGAVGEGFDYERLAQRVAELLRADESDLNRIATVVMAESAVQEAAEEPAEEPAQEAAEEPAEEAEEPEPEEELAAAVDERAIPLAVESDPDMMTRYKRSFAAKIMQCEEEVKRYYSDLKNAFLSYKKVNSQINWTNDRFAFGRETIAKIGVRGKTLCLYLALPVDEFPTTVYHQKFAGDTKMYEKTPMMVKIKSGVALKRAIRLVELLMEREGAVRVEKPYVDYVKDYAYRTDEELLAEGLVKTALIEKTDLNF